MYKIIFIRRKQGSKTLPTIKPNFGYYSGHFWQMARIRVLARFFGLIGSLAGEEYVKSTINAVCLFVCVVDWYPLPY